MVRTVLSKVAPTIFGSTRDQTSRRAPHGLSGSGPGPLEWISGGKNDARLGHIGAESKIMEDKGRKRKDEDDSESERYLTKSGGHFIVGKSVDVESQKSL